MSSSRYRSIFVVTVITTTAIALGSGCAETSIDVGERPEIEASAPPSFTPPTSDASTDADPRASEARQLCIATTCPAPFDSCGNGYRCSTNLSNDPNNCGECGKVCPTDFGYMHLSSTCVNGACEPVCGERPLYGATLKFADCNKVLEDGCEIGISTDANNCGACGNKCADGVRCIDGKCGCDPGQLDCNGQCTDVRDNDSHCGACGNACTRPADAGAPPPNMVYGCVNNQCGQLKCVDQWGDTYADCDKNQANGCEVYIGAYDALIDPNHCGACGNKCADGQLCADINYDSVPECACSKPNETLCGNVDHYNLGCVDLLNNVENCGTCFNACSTYSPNTTSQCRKGVCEIECAEGWGDCDLDPNNGCETNLKASDGHCGACGSRCDTQAGQPCVDGKCAMTECDAGVTK